MLCDMHHHLVYGVDDGSQSLEESLRMLDIARSQGIDTIVCTSHVAPGKTELNLEMYHAHLQELQKLTTDIQLLPGAEILYTSRTVELLQAGLVPTLNGTNHVLIEFRPDSPFFLIS